MSHGADKEVFCGEGHEGAEEVDRLLAHRSGFLAEQELPITVRELGSHRGYGVVAAADLDPGVCVLAEKPALIVQTAGSRGVTTACMKCLCPMASRREAESGNISGVPCACGAVFCCNECHAEAEANGHAHLCVARMSKTALVAWHSLQALLAELPQVGEAFESAIRLLAASVDMKDLWPLLTRLVGCPWWQTLKLSSSDLLAEAEYVSQRIFELLQQ
eukprot:6123913-Amphidinium_carterae.1